MKNKKREKWLKDWKTRKPSYIPLDNIEKAFEGPLNDSTLSNKRNQINTGINFNDVTPNPSSYLGEV